tara:strand:+ start:133 stop:576 length:444 start_codon:yes stop_codon:yes gene_type:complete
MATQNFMSDLWGRYGLTFKNEAIFQSHPAESTSTASTTLTPQPSNPKKSTGDYEAPIQIIHVMNPMFHPMYREQNEMQPLEQKEKNIMLETIAAPDPRMNRTGTHVTYEKRLTNMDIQTPPFNYNGIMGVVGILVGIYIIVFLARRK